MGANHKISIYLTFVVIFSLTASAQETELSCPSYWSDSTVDVLVSVPLASVPPGGKDFFLLHPPVLQDLGKPISIESLTKLCT